MERGIFPVRTLAALRLPPGVARLFDPRVHACAAGGRGGGWPTGPRARRRAGSAASKGAFLVAPAGAVHRGSPPATAL